MEIRGVGGINPTDKSQSAQKPKAQPYIQSVNNSTDSLKVSDEARFLEDEAFVKEVLAKTPDIDQEKINRIKQKINDGSYNNKEVMDALTDKLAKILGL